MIIDANEMHTMMNTMNENMRNKIYDIDELKKEIMGLINEDKLQGEAYNSGKQYFKVVWIPLLNGIQSMCSSTITANNRYMNEFHSQVDGSRTAYIDTDYLQEGVTRLNRLREIMEYEIGIPSWMNMDLYENLYETRHLQEMIEKLHNFDAEAGSYYDEARYYYEQVKSGMNMLSQGTWSDNDRKFTINVKLMDWTSNIFNKLNKTTKKKRDKFKKFIQEAYGFDDETVELMMRARDNLFRCDELKGKSKEYKEWLFLRMVSHTTYEGFSWDMTSGGLPKFKKIQTYGYGYAGEVITFPKYSEEECFMLLAGLSKEEYKLLRYKLRIQHLISSDANGEWELTRLKLGNNGELYESTKKFMEVGLGRKLSDVEFEKLYQEQLNCFRNKGDFAHFMYTSASYYEKNLVKETLGKQRMNKLAGWLGDATITNAEPGGVSETTSFKNDDYISDLDAANIAYLMEKDNLDFMSASNHYFSGLGTNYTRADKFKEHTSYDMVIKLITEQSFAQDVAQLPPVSFTYVDVEAFDDILKYPDTYNFVKSIENGDNELKNYYQKPKGR